MSAGEDEDRQAGKEAVTAFELGLENDRRELKMKQEADDEREMRRELEGGVKGRKAGGNLRKSGVQKKGNKIVNLGEERREKAKTSARI